VLRRTLTREWCGAGVAGVTASSQQMQPETVSILAWQHSESLWWHTSEVPQLSQKNRRQSSASLRICGCSHSTETSWSPVGLTSRGLRYIPSSEAAGGECGCDGRCCCLPRHHFRTEGFQSQGHTAAVAVWELTHVFHRWHQRIR
jgi:hypothetical protein